jgi:hypothetical protein
MIRTIAVSITNAIRIGRESRTLMSPSQIKRAGARVIQEGTSRNPLSTTNQKHCVTGKCRTASTITGLFRIDSNTPALGEGLEGETPRALVSTLRNVSESR